MPKIIGIGPHYRCLLKSKEISFNARPILFMKPLQSVIHSKESIIIPKDAEQVLAEVEVAIRIDKTIRNISEQEVIDLNVINGYAIANDLTAFGVNVYGNGKIYDTFTPLGDFIEIEHPTEITISSYLNNVQKQCSSTLQMSLSFEKIVSYFSSIVTLEKGDIILTGTPAGPFEIKSGDVVEVSSPQLGSVINEVKSE
ncbi:fumarylacetoacetate hydrolase family protein [Ferdinandcohnia sp. Marseille-Q9671]